MAKARTLYDKIWDDHVIETKSEGASLLYIDRHLVHEVTSPQAFEGLRLAGRKVRAPEKTLAVVDHNIQTTDRSGGIEDPESRLQVEQMAKNAREFGIEYYDEFDPRQGVVHIIGPEQGFTLPGTTIVCGDSHTSTHGAFGALAHGIGTSEVEHVLATQTLIQTKAKNMRVTVDGALGPGVTAKDIILAIIGEIGTAGGTGHVIEYAGEAIRALSMEGRMTVCNMSIEGGARAGMVAPDEKTFAYLKDRPKSPKGALWDQAVAYWSRLATDEGAHFDHEVRLDAARLPPIVSWGTSPQDVVSINGVVPRVEDGDDRAEARLDQALARLYGPWRRREDHRHRHRPRLPRLLHQRPDRGFARGGEDRRGAQGRRARQGDGRAGLRPGEGAGRAGGARRDLQGGGLRMARAGLLDVPRHEPRQARARRALRLDLEPQFRRPPGLQGPHPSGVARDGGGGGDRRTVRRCEGVAVAGRIPSLLVGEGQGGGSRIGDRSQSSARRILPMPWKATCVMDERTAFIVDWKGVVQPMTALCEAHGISRKTGYKWRDRYLAGGWDGLVDGSRARHELGHTMAGEIAAAVIALRLEHPLLGPRKLKKVLERERPDVTWPAASTIGDPLRREGLSEARRRRRRALPVTQPFAEARQPNDLWCIDFKGWFRTRMGSAAIP